MLKKSLSIVIASALFLSMSTTVYAGTNVVANASSGDDSRFATDIFFDGDRSIFSDSINGFEASVEVEKNVEHNNYSTRSNTEAIVANADGENSRALVSVGESVTGHYTGIVVATGIRAIADNKGQASVSVGDGLNVSGDVREVIGIDARVKNADSSVSINVGEGGINVEKGANSVIGGGATGIELDSRSGSNNRAELKVEGGINVKAPDNVGAVGSHIMLRNGNLAVIDIGQDVCAKGDGAHAVYVMAGDGSTANISVGGDIVSESNTDLSDSHGASLYASGQGSEIDARVGGDVKGKGLLVTLLTYADTNSSVNVFSEGTISAGSAGTIVAAGGGNINLTIWEAEPDPSGLIVRENDRSVNEATAYSQALEKAINYIIKVEPGQNIELNNTREMTYTSGDGSVTKYDTAREGEKVVVKLNIPEGYELIKAYSDKDHLTELVKENNEYYLYVPRGGGVLVGMELMPLSFPSIGDFSEGESQGAEDALQGQALVNAAAKPAPIINSIELKTNVSDYYQGGSINVPEGAGNLVFTLPELLACRENGQKSVTFVTGSGSFSISEAVLKSLFANESDIASFGFNGNLLLIFVNGRLVGTIDMTGDVEGLMAELIAQINRNTI